MTENSTASGRRRRTSFRGRGILQVLANRSVRPVTALYTRDKVDGFVDISFVPKDGNTTHFRLPKDQAHALAEWLWGTSTYAA